MNPINFAVFILAFTVTICWGGIIAKHSVFNESSQLVDAVVNVVECYYKNGGKATGLIGHMPERFNRQLSEKLIPVTLLDNYRKASYKNPLYRREMYKLNVFVLTASSAKRFYESIRMAEGSKWWDRTAHYFIVNWSSTNNDACIVSAKYLLKTWENSMINSRVVCQNRTGQVKLYGYNPYATKARESWKIERIYSGKKMRPFAVFSQDYRYNRGVCDTVGADVVNNLDGYPFCIMRPYLRFSIDKNEYKSFVARNLQAENVLQLALSTLNVTTVYASFFDFYGRTTSMYNMKTCMSTSLSSTSYVSVSHYQDSFHMFAYPIQRDNVLAITKFRGHLTQLEKILSVTDVPSRIGLCLVLLFTVIFFKYFVGHPVGASLLNVSRIVCNTGFANMPENSSPRLYIGTVLLFAVVMQGIYQGNLAALLTQAMPIRDPMTRQDLFDMGYTIYTRPEYVEVCFADLKHDGRVHIRLRYCPQMVKKSLIAACVLQENSAKDAAWYYKLHVVGTPLATIYSSYVYPQYTPLEERMDMILLRILETGIAVPMSARGLDRRVSDFEFDEVVQKNQDVKVIALGDLEFAFVIQGIGITCATIALIIELVIANRPRTMKTRIRFLN